MTSHNRRVDDQFKFTSKTPHFFKVILQEQEAIQNGKLRIPRKFVRKYGDQLPSSVELEVPSGAIWKVELTKCDEEVWLQKGWQKFADHYSLELGHFVVFRYDGKGRFHVLIFDKSASEIEYPCTNTEHTYVEHCDHVDVSLSSRKSNKEKPNLACPRPQKKKQLTARRSVKTEVLSCMQKMTATEKAHAVQIASAYKGTGNPVFMVVMQPSVISNRYRMSIPWNFALKFLTKQNGDLTLCKESTGKTWPAKYLRSENISYIQDGWRAFAEENNLGFGDICVFELIKHPEILLKVIIYPVAENARNSFRPPTDRSIGIGSRVKISSLVDDTEPNCKQRCPSSSREFKDPKIMKKKSDLPCPRSPKKIRTDSPNNQPATDRHLDVEILSSRDSGSRIKLENLKKVENSRCLTEQLDAMQGVGGITAPRSVERNVISCEQKLKAAEKAHAVQIASAFIKCTGNPVFVMVMQPSFVSNGYKLTVPSTFAREFLTMKNGNLMLCDFTGKTWPVSLRVWSRKEKPRLCMQGGWRAFAEDNNLVVGDICVFELIKHQPEIIFKVIIYPVVENASKAGRPLCDGSIASRVKFRSLVGDTQQKCKQIIECHSSYS